MYFHFYIIISFFLLLFTHNHTKEIQYKIQKDNNITVNYNSIPENVYVGIHNIAIIQQVLEHYIQTENYQKANILFYSVQNLQCPNKQYTANALEVSYLECLQMRKNIIQKYQNKNLSQNSNIFAFLMHEKRYIVKDTLFGTSLSFAKYTPVYFYHFIANRFEKNTLYLYKWDTRKKNQEKSKRNYIPLENYISNFESYKLNIDDLPYTKKTEINDILYLEIFYYKNYHNIQEYQKVWQERLPLLQNIPFQKTEKFSNLVHYKKPQEWYIKEGKYTQKSNHYNVIIAKKKNRGFCFITKQNTTHLKIY